MGRRQRRGASGAHARVSARRRAAFFVQTQCRAFPGGPVVRTAHFHGQELGFDHWAGN